MRLLLLVLLWASIYARELVGTNSTTNGACDTCIGNSSQYWCAMKANSSFGFWCDASNSKSYCLGSENEDDYVCSNENLPGKSQYLLCPQSGSNCGDSGDFVISAVDQNMRVDTGIVPPGTTCENRNYISYSGSTASKYTLTVIVDYVLYDTRLGIYYYDRNSNSYEEVTEVSTNYTGNLTANVESNREVYVLMNPYHNLSCAGYNVSVGTYTSEDDDDLSVAIIIVIVLWAVAFSVAVGGITFFLIYKFVCKSKKDSSRERYASTDTPIGDEGYGKEDIQNEQAEVSFRLNYILLLLL